MKRMTGNFPHGGTTMDDHFDRMRLLIQVPSSSILFIYLFNKSDKGPTVLWHVARLLMLSDRNITQMHKGNKQQTMYVRTITVKADTKALFSSVQYNTILALLTRTLSTTGSESNARRSASNYWLHLRWIIVCFWSRGDRQILSFCNRCWTRSCSSIWIRVASLLISTSVTDGFFSTLNEVRYLRRLRVVWRRRKSM